MSEFEITEEHLRFLTMLILRGGSIRSDSLTPSQSLRVEELGSHRYLDDEIEYDRGTKVHYSINKLSLKVVQMYGSNALEDALEELSKKLS